jgi:hypothetical protein
MPDSNEEQQPSSNPQQPKKETRGIDVYVAVVDSAVAIILLLTMMGAFRYASEAHTQNVLLARNVEQEILNNRPVLIPNGVEVNTKTPDGIPVGVTVKLRNYGKTLAVGVVSAGEILIVGAGESVPIDVDCNESGAIPKLNVPYVKSTPAIGMGESADLGWTLAPNEAQLLERINLDGVLYVVGCAYYSDLDNKTRYFSDVCVSWVPKAPQDFQNCDDANRNYAH